MLVVFVSVPVIALEALACDCPPVNPVPVGAAHVNVVPDGIIPLVLFVGVDVNATPLQVVVLIAVTIAAGFNDIVTVNTGPVQVPDVGVTW